MPVYFLSNELIFPSPYLASPEGLLAVGGDLSTERLLLAYRMGIFPWYGEGEPILWWSPNPRLVLYPDQLHISKRLQRILKKNTYHFTMDTAFEAVIKACRQTRIQNQEETWIVDEMIPAYCRLHRSGYAHSVEAWHNDRLVGGLYGVSLGKSFFGESMFTKQPDASKIAFVTFVKYLRKASFDLIDCQITTKHLINFGAVNIKRDQFLKQLESSLQAPTMKGKWSFSR